MPNLGNDSNVHYVKFIRGTISAWENLLNNTPEKISDDTLYFIYENPQTSYEGKLYLGKKLISGYGNGSSENININDIGDILIDDQTLSDKQILVYNDTSQQWENTSLSTIISTAVSVMTGATTAAAGTSGLVPAPAAGDENKFLKGNGTWSLIPVPSVDTNSITVINGQLSLTGFSGAAVGSIPLKTNNGIEWSTGITGSLNRQIVSSIEDLRELMTNQTANPNTIYMVPNNNSSESSDRYQEYMIIDDKLELLGTFGQVDLVNYVTITNFNTRVGSIENVLQDTINSETGVVIPGLVSRVSTIENNFLTFNSKIGNLDNLILSNNNETLVEEVNTINERLKWQNLNNLE